MAKTPEKKAADDVIARLLKSSPANLKKTLVALATEMPDVVPWLERRLDAPKSPERSRAAAELVRRSVKRSLGRAYRVDSAYHVISEVLGDFQDHRTAGLAAIDAGDTAGGLEILVILAEAMPEAFALLDDSDGEVGDFVFGLGRDLAGVTALATDFDDDDRKSLIRRLEGPSREVAEYGIDEGFDDAILAATAALPGAETTPDEHDRIVSAQLHGLQRIGATQRYLELSREQGHHAEYALALLPLGRIDEALEAALLASGESPQIALLLARTFRKSGATEAAFEIAKAGFAAHVGNRELADWLATAAESAGDTATAAEAYRRSFTLDTSLAAFEGLRRHLGDAWSAERPALLQQAIRDGAVDILLVEQLWDEAIAAIDAPGARLWGYGPLEELVATLAVPRPEWTIAQCERQLSRLLEIAESSRYPAAARWLEILRQAYQSAGRPREWNAYLAQFRTAYRRRPSLMAKTQRLRDL